MNNAALAACLFGARLISNGNHELPSGETIQERWSTDEGRIQWWINNRNCALDAEATEHGGWGYVERVK